MAWTRFLFRPAPLCSYCCHIAATPSLFKKLFGKVQGADSRGPEIGLLRGRRAASGCFCGLDSSGFERETALMSLLNTREPVRSYNPYLCQTRSKYYTSSISYCR